MPHIHIYYRYHHRITTDPHIISGKPVVKSTCVPVEIILERLAKDLDTQKLFVDYPRLSEEDIKACLTYAKERVEEEPTLPQATSEGIHAALMLAGAWSDLPADDLEERLDQIRHESQPTPPIDTL